MTNVLKYGILILLSVFSFNVLAEEPAPKKKDTFLLLQCKNHYERIHNRLRNINSNLIGADYWTITNNDGFFYVPFGVNWEDVEETCYAYPVYIEIATYNRSISYADVRECKEGIYGRGKKYKRDSHGGFFEGAFTNSFIPATETCNIQVKYRYVDGTALKLQATEKRTCELAKLHFYNLITDSDYGKEGWHRNWQDLKCKEITIETFELKTGISVKELRQTVAKEII